MSMTLPEAFDFHTAVKDVVLNAKKEGNLGDLTPRMIRREIERSFSLVEKLLDAKEYKKPLKDAIAAAMDDSDENDEPESSTSRARNHKKKTKPDGGQVSQKKTKPTGMTSESSQRTKLEKKRKRNASKECKSSEAVQSSGVEDDGDEEIGKKNVSSSSISETKVSEKQQGNEDDRNMPPKKRRKAEEESNDYNSQVSIPVGKRTSVSPTPKAQDDENENKSDSELSVLIDEPPKRGKKSKTKVKEEGKTAQKGKKPKNTSVELSKDEETIKRLKSLVVGCGVRKVWSKVFQDMDRPSQQIKRLKEILADLGMTGRMSMEQAKAIRQKRELAQELEDVQSFEKSVVSGNRTKSRSTKPERESEEESEDEPDIRAKRKNTARQSIMAFLADDSEEE